MFNFWGTRRDKQRIYTVVGIVAPIVLAVLTIGLLQTVAVRSSFLAYMIVANTQCELRLPLISLADLPTALCFLTYADLAQPF